MEYISLAFRRKPLFNLRFISYSADYLTVLGTFRGSSMVEQLPVKELVVGSSPTRGAKKKRPEHVSGSFLFLLSGRTKKAGAMFCTGKTASRGREQNCRRTILTCDRVLPAELKILGLN